MTVLFGYQPISRPAGMPPCPCGDNHVAMEASADDPLECVIRCWCGLAERDAFVKAATGA